MPAPGPRVTYRQSTRAGRCARVFLSACVWCLPRFQPGEIARVALQRVNREAFLDLYVTEEFADEIALVQWFGHRSDYRLKLSTDSTRYAVSKSSYEKEGSRKDDGIELF